MVMRKEATYTATTVAAVMVNYAVGTGMLNLPHTIARASVSTSAIMICIISLVSYCLARYTLKTLRYSFALSYHKTSSEAPAYLGAVDTEKESLLRVDESAEESHTERSIEKIPDFSIPNDVTIEVSRMCMIYYGKIGFYTYEIALILNLFGSVWGYSQVVASSLTSVIPFTSDWLCEDPCGAGGYAANCEIAYVVYIVLALVFGCGMVFVDMSKQRVLQTFFSCCRLTCIVSMAILVFASIFSMPYTADEDGPPYVEDLSMASFDFKSFGTLFSSATFSLIMHHSIPGIVQPTKPEEQRHLDNSIKITFIGLFCFTVFIGFCAAFFFGENGAHLITLNLTRWNGKIWTADTQPAWAAVISYFIRLLPPIWVLSCLPINGVTLSNNILEIFPDRLRAERPVIITARLLAVAPPVILAGFARCLGDIIEFTGLCAYVLLIMPAFLMLKSKRKIRERFPDYTPDESVLDSDWVIWVIIAFNCLGVICTTYSIIVGLFE